MARARVALTLLLVALLIFSTRAMASPEDFTSSKLHHPKSSLRNAVSKAAHAIISKLGWNDKEAKISHIDTIDARFGQAIMYEFDIQLGDKITSLKLSENISTWKYMEEVPTVSSKASDMQVTPSWQWQDLVGNFGPFQLSGPMELSIQDAEFLRLAVPDEIEARDLKKVLLAEGTVLTVEGAREVSLAHPLQLPLPLQGISKDGGLAASLLALASRLKHASQTEEKPLLLLKVAGPTSLVASSSKNSLKVKRLGSGSIKLELGELQEEALNSTVHSSVTLRKSEEDPWLWPSPSVELSDSRMIRLEEVLLSAMGPSIYKRGSFNLLKAQVSMETFVRIEFQLERKLSKSSSPLDEWKTQPSVERQEFEFLAKLESQELVPISVQRLQPYKNVETSTWSALMGNVSHSKKMPRVYLQPSTMTLDPK